MSIDKKTIDYVAHLARIELTPQELERFSRQLQDILGFIDKLKELNTQEISPASHVLALTNVLREDLPAEGLTSEEALKNSPSRKGSFFSVPKVIE